MAHLKKTSFILFLICLFALFFRLCLLFTLQPWDEQVLQNKVIVGDSDGYQTRALSIVASRSLSSLGAFRTPGYIMFLAAIYFLLGVKPWAVLLLQLFLDIGIVIIVYFIAKEIFKSKTAPLIAAILYSVSFPSAYYSIRLLSEIPFTFVFALAILIFIRSLKENKLLGFALTGFLIGIATYFRPVALYFPAVLLFILLFSNSGLLLKLRNILVVFILFSITLSPWQFRNLKLYGHYAFTSKPGENLCTWNVATVKANAENINRYEAIDKLVGNSLEGITNPFEESKIYKKIAFSYIREHPLQYIKYHIKGASRMFLGTSRSGITDLFGIKAEPPLITEPLSLTANKIIKNLHNEFPTLILSIKQLLEYMFLIIGAIIMWRKDKDKRLSLLFLIMIIAYFAVLTGPIGYSRFRVPIVPFYLLISAKGIFETFRFIMNKR